MSNKKDAFYFPHDSNARQDDKIIALRMKHGWEGYGLFWAIIERLRDTADYLCIKDYNLVAFDLRVDASKIKSIVEDFGLFAFTDDGKCFYSESLTNRMTPRDEAKKIASINGIIGNLIKNGYGTREQLAELSEEDLIAFNEEIKLSGRRPTDPQPPPDRHPTAKRKEERRREKKKKDVDAPNVANTHSPDEVSKFQQFQKHLKVHYPQVAAMKKPFSIDEYLKIQKKIPKEQVKELLMAMENKADLRKRYKSAYLTILSWSKMDWRTEKSTKNEQTKGVDPRILEKLK